MGTPNGMKTKIIRPRRVSLGLIIIFLLLFVGVSLPAEAEVDSAKAGITPDSFFYFLERIIEAIGTFFTFGDLKKAERYVVLATERLVEVDIIAEEDKPKLIEKTLERYKAQLEKAVFRAEKAKTKCLTKR